jgi:hypothetical protein
MAVLVMSGDYVPACVMGMIHREMHWRKTYESRGFNWDSEAWNDGQCQDLLHFPRVGAEKLGRLFFLPAMQSAPGTNGVELLQHDSDGNPVWVARNKARFVRPYGGRRGVLDAHWHFGGMQMVAARSGTWRAALVRIQACFRRDANTVVWLLGCPSDGRDTLLCVDASA